jgi:hypothetical protein
VAQSKAGRGWQSEWVVEHLGVSLVPTNTIIIGVRRYRYSSEAQKYGDRPKKALPGVSHTEYRILPLNLGDFKPFLPSFSCPR